MLQQNKYLYLFKLIGASPQNFIREEASHIGDGNFFCHIRNKRAGWY